MHYDFIQTYSLASLQVKLMKTEVHLFHFHLLYGNSDAYPLGPKLFFSVAATKK